MAPRTTAAPNSTQRFGTLNGARAADNAELTVFTPQMTTGLLASVIRLGSQANGPSTASIFGWRHYAPYPCPCQTRMVAALLRIHDQAVAFGLEPHQLTHR